ncbi:MAG: rhamnulokinase, partial [Phycisphaeraceae bacterium]
FDLGADSGRAMLAVVDQDRVKVDMVHRFPNQPQRLPSGLHWNLLELWRNLVEGLGKAVAAARERNVELVSLGVDTWGVDFGLVGKSGQLLGLPYAYRDERHPPAMEKAAGKLGYEAIYEATGIQFLPFNSVYQLLAQQEAEPSTLDAASRLLTMPDLLHYFFCGEMVNEATNASTTQMVDPHTGEWHRDLLEKLGLPSHFLHGIVPAGTKIGKLREDLARKAGVEPLDVIVPGTHDTASAVASVPAGVEGATWAYLSSGTWSLMGAELDEPIISEASRQAGFTNERGVAGKIRFLKNIAGLWLVQESRRDYASRGEDYSYPELEQQAIEAEPFRTLVNPDYRPFATPGDMLSKIDGFAEKTGQPKPERPGQYVRCCLESLALSYRQTLKDLEQLLGKRVDVLHIVGGGGRDDLLDQMTADALFRPVEVGPFEATALGNALTQALGAGQVRDLDHLRAIVRASYRPQTFMPRHPDGFRANVERFTGLCEIKS